jgi:hypothetical protein
MFTFIKRYVPNSLTKKDKKKQRSMLTKSRKMYKQNKYYTRKPVSSYTHKTSRHITNAKRIYNVQTVSPNSELASKTGCSVDALRKIVKKGEGAYYSSGSRPNQTPQSWGLARLASSITAGNAAKVDYDILEKGCKPGSKALKLAKTRKQ